MLANISRDMLSYLTLAYVFYLFIISQFADTVARTEI